MFHLKRIAVAVSLALFITGCSQDNSEQATAPSEAQVAQNQEAPVESAVSESEKANELFESIFMENVMRSPMYQSYLGIKQDQDKWDDISEQRQQEDLTLQQQQLEQVLAIDVEQGEEKKEIRWKWKKKREEK